MHQDQLENAVHVVQCIKRNCKRLSSHFPCFRIIRDHLDHGDSLQAIPLTGGLTNYSYKVRLEKTPDVTLFAKLSFPYALWNPKKDAHYDVQRTRNEFEMMKKFAQVAPNCAPTPYLCERVDDMMVLVTEWRENDEQLVCQVVDGELDIRVCSRLARSMAHLHCMDFDPEFNTGIRTTMLSTFDTLYHKLESMLRDTTDNSRAALMVREMGLENCQRLVDDIQYLYEHSRDCLVHSDLHVKNILVEPKANGGRGKCFGPKGTFSVVDWEMAFAGPVGRDLGTFFPFPLCSAMAHAIRGNTEGATNLLHSLDYIWEQYAQALRDGGKDEDFINHAFRSIVGWCGRFMFLGFYTSGVHVDDFPLDDITDKDILMDAIGVLGLKMMKWGFDTKYETMSTIDMEYKFKQMIWQEIASIISLKASCELSAHCVPMPMHILFRGDGFASLVNLLGHQRAVGRLVSLDHIAR